ncbi:MAG: lasso peptide biosynthesis B2 protein [Anaerolineae bacterium]|nr:lasso peptide biosynthesis B2 protein [Anaerolineae bacterium]
MRSLVRFSRLPADKRGVLLRASALLVCFNLSLRLFPFRITRPLVTRLAQPPRRPPARSTTPEYVRWATNSAGRKLRATCLPKALTAYVLLRRAGHAAVLRIGVYQEEAGTLTAHAWVRHNDTIIVGEVDDLTRFVPLPDLWPHA